MFRPMRRSKKEISQELAEDLLKTAVRGVLAVNGDDGYPFAIPINYYYDSDAKKIYFHGAKAGHKVDSLKKDDKVCFTVYGNEHVKEGDWANTLQSVVVFGRCQLVDDPEATASHVRTLAEKYYPSTEAIDAEMKKDLPGAQLYVITIEHMTGKEVTEK